MRVWGRRVSVHAFVGVLVGVAVAALVSSVVSHVMVWLVFPAGFGVMLHMGRLDGRAMGVSLLVWTAALLRALPTAWRDRLRRRRRILPVLHAVEVSQAEVVWL